MSQLEAQRAKVEALMGRYGLEVWDAPDQVRNIAAGGPQVSLWSMRIGNPKANEDIFVHSMRGEYALWEEAEQEIMAYVTARGSNA